MSLKFTATLRFAFKTAEHALIAAKSLSVNDDPKRRESISTFSGSDHFLIFEVRASSAKHLKKAITTTLPSIELIEQTINEFALD
jgi:hypothetical protein